MHLSPRRTPLATLGTMAGLALALSACADPLAPTAGVSVEPVAAIGTDNSQPLQETFGTGISVVGGRDTRVEVCEGAPLGGPPAACAPADFYDAYVLTKNPRWAFPIGTPGSIAPASVQTQWVGPDPDASEYYTEDRGDDEYRTTFNLPSNAASPTLNIQLYSDNLATVYVNGVEIGMQPSGGTADGDHYPNYGCGYLVPALQCGEPTDTDNLLLTNDDWVAPIGFTTTGETIPWVLGGSNTVRIVVHNAEYKQDCVNVPLSTDCQSATGLDFLAQVRYTLRGDEGCTPGYWKQSQHFDSWPAGIDPTDLISEYFAGAGPMAGTTLLDALNGGGGAGVDGARRILLRAAVAALLNSASTGVDYTMTSAEIVAAVNAALASGDRDTMLDLAGELDEDNNGGYPLN